LGTTLAELVAQAFMPAIHLANAAALAAAVLQQRSMAVN
jgi:hypothetical protein